ncbi:MAG TPA: hypothetical protein DCS60_04840 [Opitutae bacterium]|nr:hypothetical protein [Opitutae bacterium]
MRFVWPDPLQAGLDERNRLRSNAQHKFEIEGWRACPVACTWMTDLIEEVRELLKLYPPWLVTTCLIVVGAGLLYVIWRIVKFGIVLVVTALLLALVAFAAWTLIIA